MSHNGTITLEAEAPVRLQFADRQRGMFTPLGDTGLNRYGGMIFEEVNPKLQGQRWFRIIREMMHNPTIRGMLFAVELPIRRAEWMMEPAADGGTEAQEIADFVDSCRRDMRTTWEDSLAQILGFLPYGYSLFEIILKRRLGDEGNPTSSSDDGLIGWDDWMPRSQDTLYRWVFDDYGRVTAFEQQAPAQTTPVVIPLSRCLHFRAGGYKGSPEGESVLRAAYVDWDAIRKIELLEAIRIEKDATGVLTLYIPANYLSENATAQQQRVFQAAKDIVTGYHTHEQAGFVFPLEYDDKGNPLFKAELLKTGGERQIDTSVVVSRRATQMTRALLADFITLGQSSAGSYALSKTKTDLFTTAIAAWLDVIANTINAQGIAPLLRVNGIDSRLTPVLRPGAIDEADLKATADYFSALAPLLEGLNAEDRIALTSHLWDVADWPAPTTKAADLEAEEEERAAQAAAMLEKQQEGAPAESEEEPAEAEAVA